MPRPPRVDHADARHHVTSRLCSDAKKFDEEEYSLVLAILAHAVEKFPVRLHAYCLMPNHLHLAIECQKPVLSAFMKNVKQRIAQAINKRRSRRGPLFDGRFHNTLVQSDEHWLHVPAYVHLNPVDRRTIHRPEQWKWSSHRMYRNGHVDDGWLTKSEFIEAFGGRRRMLAYIEDTRRQRAQDADPKPPIIRKGVCRPVDGPSEACVWPPVYRDLRDSGGALPPDAG